MPIYEYHCTKCLKTFERFQKISEEPVKECPDCKGRIEKLISQSSFTLKGGGWYKDGYSSASSKADKSAEKPGKPAKKEEKKAETKPAKEKK